MKLKRDDYKFIVLLFGMSAALYFVHFLIFRDAHHLSLFALEDLAFVPIDVFFVSLILNRVLKSNEKKKKMSKLYMIIEIFFSIIGSDLLREFSNHDKRLIKIRDDLIIKPNWTEKDFNKMLDLKKLHIPVMEYEKESILNIKEMLEKSRPNLLRLVENQALLEHETFTEVLMAVFHLAEELRLRDNFDNLSKQDKDHIMNDCKRAYILLGIEWIDYINHMRIHYPYLYSLAIRVNPFAEHAEIAISEL
ncbi:MAG: hypothetical protein AB1Z23_08930 [Eubacteriales bacterium]